MTHIVIGYPSLDASKQTIAHMVRAGVDLIELQIPFSEPLADGPVIAHANQAALDAGTSVQDCLEFAADAASTYPIPFLYMSYYNILFKYGTGRFVERAAKAGLSGIIIPDLPPEEAGEYLAATRDSNVAPIFLFSPRTTDERLKMIAGHAKGFVYCVARTGITGSTTQFSRELERYLARCRVATTLPLAVGFGVKQPRDVEFLRGKADIAVVGSESLRVLEQRGPEAVGEFLVRLRS